MAQIIKIKGSKTNANATPSSLVERELASNLVDRCLFGSDGTSVFKYYTGSTKYFDANGYANNANKLGGQTIDYFASADGVADALDEIIDSLKGYQPLITSTNKLAYSLISGVPTSLKNPNALTINNSAGTAQVSYDGSAVKSLTLTKAMVGLGSVENTALSTWAGTNKITTLGTITTGVWNGTKIANGYLANSAITIAGTNVSLGGSITAATLQSNLGLGTFAYKSSLAFADLTNKPTTIGGFGITDAYTKSQVDSALGGYLPLSGGTLSNSSFGGALTIHRSQSGKNSVIKFTNIDGDLGYIGVGGAKGAYPNQPMFTTGGTDYGIIHSGNYTTYTYSKSTIDTKLGDYQPLDTAINKDNIGNQIVEGITTHSSSQINANGDISKLNSYYNYTGFRISRFTGLSGLGTRNVDGLIVNWPLDRRYGQQWYIDDETHTIQVRYVANAVWSDWKTIAFTDSNVASATKLQTARKLWGQSFDGTADVTGAAMGLGGAIDFQFSDEINRYGGTLYLQHRGDGSQTGTVSGATGNVVMCYRGGNVGIGINDVQYKLDVNGTLHASGMVIFDSALNVASSCRLMGNVGIGVNADDNKLCVYGVIRSAAYNAKGNNNAAFVFDKPGSNYTGIGANGVADTIYFSACSITGAWATDYYQKWHFNGEVYAKTGIWSDGYVSAKGQNTTSDMRLKNVLNDVVLNVSDIANAPSIRFAWKNGGGVDVGSSAQYWQGLLPDAVKERDGMLEMQYANIALLSAIAIAKNVETHEERIARLERENKELRNEIKCLKYGA